MPKYQLIKTPKREKKKKDKPKKITKGYQFKLDDVVKEPKELLHPDNCAHHYLAKFNRGYVCPSCGMTFDVIQKTVCPECIEEACSI